MIEESAIVDWLRQELRTVKPKLARHPELGEHFKTDLAFDSLELVELVARIEQRYGLMIPDSALPAFISLEATAKYIAGRLAT
ncbi:MAG: acyl carrier protein [Flavobacteriales bacterium]|nr:acyl carrier protein [Flavobacteriales bacterium]MBP6697339.1 acyl carrier protein [Flavobacteriales bacterium]